MCYNGNKYYFPVHCQRIMQDMEFKCLICWDFECTSGTRGRTENNPMSLAGFEPTAVRTRIEIVSDHFVVYAPFIS